MRISDVYAGGKVVDFHVHAFPDEVAARAMETLFATYQVQPVTNGTISELVALMDRTGLDYAVVQPVATKASQVQSINNWAASHTDPTVISFGAMHPDFRDPASEVERMLSLGLLGIKIQANWQGTYADDPRMYPIYDACRGKLIILFHAGAELTPFEVQRATPDRLANVHRDFPDLTIVAAHMGGYLMWDLVEEHLLGKDVYLDTSACFPHELPDERFRSMIRRHGVGKILFATDMPLNEPVGDVRRLVNMGLTDAELDLIVWGNAKRLLGERVS